MSTTDRKYRFNTGDVVRLSPRTPFNVGTITEQVGKFGPHGEPLYLVKPHGDHWTDDTRFLLAQNGLHEATGPDLDVEKAAKDTVQDVAEILAIADQSDGEQVLEEMGRKRIAHALKIDEDEVEALSPGELREMADKRLVGRPLCVEASVTFEIVLGEPDTRLLIECNRVEMNWEYERRGGGRWAYEPQRVVYRYSRSGSADFELTGDDRTTAEAFARRVVPELADV